MTATQRQRGTRLGRGKPFLSNMNQAIDSGQKRVATVPEVIEKLINLSFKV
jgi:hypothetical protein